MSKTIAGTKQECQKSVKEVSTLVKSHKIVCSLQKIMSKKRVYSFIVLAIVVLFIWIFSDVDEKKDDFSELAKISLREVGNQLLLSNKDTTSLVLPVVFLGNSKYELSFESELSFLPNDLVASAKASFEKTALSKKYRVEVIQCIDKEVAYSYEMNIEDAQTIIPCSGRFLSKKCYTVQFRFLDKKESFFSKKVLLYIGIFIASLLIQIFFFQRKKPQEAITQKKDYTTLGHFYFYPKQNKLVKQATEIRLSKKECELLEIFVANPNQILKREDLTKRVWEDNGVFVGRSLDTYISKLRKKLKEDSSIKITNIHGVGYKLEI